MRSITAAAALLAAAPFFVPEGAHAYCRSTAAGFVCEGYDYNGIYDTRPGVVGEVRPGASVRRSYYGSSAIRVGQGALVDNDGTVSGPAVRGGSRLTVLNDGRMGSGQATTIQAGTDLTVVNGASGVLQGGTQILGGNDLRLVNAGSMTGGSNLVLGADRATVVNSGQMSGSGVPVIASDQLVLSNSGSMVGGNAAVIASTRLSFDNTGTITAQSGVRAGDHATLTNAGTLDTRSRGGAVLGDRARVTNERGGRIASTGIGVSGGGALYLENRGAIEGGQDGAVVGGTSTDIRNYGGSLTSQGHAVRGTGAALGLHNTGRITARYDGVVSDGAVSVTNHGTIDARGSGVLGGDGSTLSGRGTLTARNRGAELGRRATVRAEGAIRSTGWGDAMALVDGRVEVGSRGSVTAAGGTAIRARSLGTEGSLDVTLRGTASGLVGIRAEGGNGAAQRVRMQPGSLLEGRAGLAADLGLGDDLVSALGGEIRGDLMLGAGDDAVTLRSDATMTGDVLLGSGDDTLRYERRMFDQVTRSFGLFDGGSGTDEAIFAGFGFTDLTARFLPGGFLLDFADGGTRVSARLMGFETIRLDDVTLSFGATPTAMAAAPAPVPVPAGLPLLAGAVAGLVALRRARR